MTAPRQTRNVEESIAIEAPVEAVWKALTDAEEMTRWFPLQAGENPDGTVWMAWGDDFKFVARVEAASRCATCALFRCFRRSSNRR